MYYEIVEAILQTIKNDMSSTSLQQISPELLNYGSKANFQSVLFH
jgi:hypothetical protein